MTAPDDHAHEGFGWALGVLLRAYRATVSPLLSDVPHDARGYQTLATVVHGDQPTQVALASYLGIDRTVMTYLLDDLVDAGLVERRLHPDDRRRRQIVATDHGRAVLTELQSRVHHAEELLLAGLDEAERATFRNLLHRIACNVREVDADTDPCEAAEQADSA